MQSPCTDDGQELRYERLNNALFAGVWWCLCECVCCNSVHIKCISCGCRGFAEPPPLRWSVCECLVYVISECICVNTLGNNSFSAAKHTNQIDYVAFSRHSIVHSKWSPHTTHTRTHAGAPPNRSDTYTHTHTPRHTETAA